MFGNGRRSTPGSIGWVDCFYYLYAGWKNPIRPSVHFLSDFEIHDNPWDIESLKDVESPLISALLKKIWDQTKKHDHLSTLLSDFEIHEYPWDTESLKDVESPLISAFLNKIWDQTKKHGHLSTFLSDFGIHEYPWDIESLNDVESPLISAFRNKIWDQTKKHDHLSIFIYDFGIHKYGIWIANRYRIPIDICVFEEDLRSDDKTWPSIYPLFYPISRSMKMAYWITERCRIPLDTCDFKQDLRSDERTWPSIHLFIWRFQDPWSWHIESLKGVEFPLMRC